MNSDFISRLDDLERVRYEKVQRLRERGIEPYPLRASRTHTANQAVTRFRAGESMNNVRLAGRITANRWTGKITFLDLRDGSGRIQLLVKQDALGEEVYKAFLKDYDLGDFIGVSGNVFESKRGEVTLEVHEITMLAKAIAPPPEKWHGLKDVEQRYRQRYVDLMSSDDVRHIFIARTKIIAAMRRYLDAHGFIEVETPTLQPIYGGALAKPFTTHHNELDRELYLRIATELYLKRLIVGGLDAVYEIGKDFRNEGIDATHQPEFTMMECYQAYADYTDIMKLVEEVINECAQAALGTTQIEREGKAINLTPPWPRISMRDAILEATGVDIYVDSDLDSLSARIEEKNMRVEPKLSWGKQVDELFGEYVQPKLIQPTFIIDHPVEISPFAKRKPDNPRVVERFEAFAGGMECGNAFTELNDPEDQFTRFQEQARALRAGDAEAQQMDEDFIRALMHGMPPTGGLGIGIDRLSMLLTGQHSIRDVILFPQLRT
jgi:lysyl-tRNA synthetase class 2